MSKTATVVILQSSDDDADRCKEDFENDYDVKCATSDSEVALSELGRIKPDFFISSLFLHHADGLSVIKRIKSLSDKTVCIVLDYAKCCDVVMLALRSGVDLYVALPIDFDLVKDKMKNTVNYSELDIKDRVIGLTLDIDEAESETVHTSKSSDGKGGKIVASSDADDENDRKLDLLIGRLFISIGISPNIRGFNFLRCAIKLTIKNPRLIESMTKGLYPEIAKDFDTTGSKVERAIRHALDVAWNKGKSQQFNELLGVTAFSENERPTNSEFIALVADRLMLQEAIIS